MSSSTSSSNRRNAARLLLRFIAFTALLGLCLPIILFLSGLSARGGRMGTAFAKHARLAALAEPKLVLVGGSSFQYGVDSPALESLLGRPVVNMGIQGSIGTEYMFAEVEPSLKAGDWVVVALEQAHFYNLDPEGETALYRAASVYPSGVRHLTHAQWLHLPQKGWVAALGNLQDAQVTALQLAAGRETYAAQSNAQGDYIGHRDRVSAYRPASTPAVGDISAHALEVLSQFITRAERRGACVMVSHAPIAASAVTDKVLADIDEAVAPLGPISRASDYRFPDSYFYDTASHLTYDRRIERTTKLAQDIERSPRCH